MLLHNKFVRPRWFAPTLHILIFAMTWLAAFAQAEPLLDGPARWGFVVLFIADFPISLVAFSAMWDGKPAYALTLWGILGTAWWYFLGVLIHSGYKRLAELFRGLLKRGPGQATSLCDQMGVPSKDQPVRKKRGR